MKENNVKLLLLLITPSLHERLKLLLLEPVANALVNIAPESVLLVWVACLFIWFVCFCLFVWVVCLFACLLVFLLAAPEAS